MNHNFNFCELKSSPTHNVLNAIWKYVQITHPKTLFRKPHSSSAKSRPFKMYRKVINASISFGGKFSRRDVRSDVS